jgi:hypothetical protein
VTNLRLPQLREARGWLVDFIQVTTFPAVQDPGPIVGAGLPGLMLASLAGGNDARLHPAS